MRIGDIDIGVIMDGTFRLDAGSMFGIVPKSAWKDQVKTDRRNRMTLGLNCFLIRSGKTNILVDTGVGTKHTASRKSRYAMSGGRLAKELSLLGLSPSDIHVVVLTHLHFDHAGGCTYLNSKNVATPFFPKAQYLVQHDDWNEATHPNERTRAGYFSDDFIPLEREKQIELVEGEVEVTSRVKISRTGGHTAGHQGVFIESQGQRAASLGDLLPTELHLPIPFATAWDLNPIEGLLKKKEVLLQAEKEQWLLLFGHGYPGQAGYLERLDERLILRGISLR